MNIKMTRRYWAQILCCVLFVAGCGSAWEGCYVHDGAMGDGAMSDGDVDRLPDYTAPAKLLWAKRCGPSSDYSGSVVVDSKGHVIVLASQSMSNECHGGGNLNSTNGGYILAMYDSTGPLLGKSLALGDRFNTLLNPSLMIDESDTIYLLSKVVTSGTLLNEPVNEPSVVVATIKIENLQLTPSGRFIHFSMNVPHITKGVLEAQGGKKYLYFGGTSGVPISHQVYRIDLAKSIIISSPSFGSNCVGNLNQIAAAGNNEIYVAGICKMWGGDGGSGDYYVGNLVSSIDPDSLVLGKFYKFGGSSTADSPAIAVNGNDIFLGFLCPAGAKCQLPGKGEIEPKGTGSFTVARCAWTAQGLICSVVDTRSPLMGGLSSGSPRLTVDKIGNPILFAPLTTGGSISYDAAGGVGLSGEAAGVVIKYKSTMQSIVPLNGWGWTFSVPADADVLPDNQIYAYDVVSDGNSGNVVILGGVIGAPLKVSNGNIRYNNFSTPPKPDFFIVSLGPNP